MRLGVCEVVALRRQDAHDLSLGHRLEPKPLENAYGQKRHRSQVLNSIARTEALLSAPLAEGLAMRLVIDQLLAHGAPQRRSLVFRTQAVRRQIEKRLNRRMLGIMLGHAMPLEGL